MSYFTRCTLAPGTRIGSDICFGLFSVGRGGNPKNKDIKPNHMRQIEKTLQIKKKIVLQVRHAGRALILLNPCSRVSLSLSLLYLSLFGNVHSFLISRASAGGEDVSRFASFVRSAPKTTKVRFVSFVISPSVN